MVNSVHLFLYLLVQLCFWVSLLVIPVQASTVIEKHMEKQAVLNIVTDKAEMEMGKFLSVQLVYLGQSIPEPAQLHSWNRDFYIEEMSRDSERLPGGYIKTIQYLRLYPRTTGIKTLHAIAQGGAIARPVDINVRALIRNNINGAPHWNPPLKEIWQGETIIISIVQNLMTDNNQVKTEEARFPGFSVLRSWQESEFKNGINSIRVNWQLKAQNYGHFTLDAPAIVQRGSRGRWRFYLPEIEIFIKPVPAYIPPTVPVAQIEVSSRQEHTDSQPFWLLSVKSYDHLGEEIYGIRRQLAGIAHTTPDRVRFVTGEQFTDTVKQSVQTWRVAVPTWTMPLKNTQISIDYFDPKQGLLKQRQIQLPSLWFVPAFAQYLLLVLLLLLIGLVVFYLIKWFKAWQQRIIFIRDIEACGSPDQLRQLLLQISDSRTLSEWAEQVQDRSLQELAQSLNLLCFKDSNNGAANDLLSPIKSRLIDYFSHKA